MPFQADGPAAVDVRVVAHTAAVQGRPQGSPLRLVPAGIGLGKEDAGLVRAATTILTTLFRLNPLP